jgi:hypothetical protein
LTHHNSNNTHLAHCEEPLDHVLAALVDGSFMQDGPEALKHAVQPSRCNVLQVRANLQNQRQADRQTTLASEDWQQQVQRPAGTRQPAKTTAGKQANHIRKRGLPTAGATSCRYAPTCKNNSRQTGKPHQKTRIGNSRCNVLQVRANLQKQRQANRQTTSENEEDCRQQVQRPAGTRQPEGQKKQADRTTWKHRDKEVGSNIVELQCIMYVQPSEC